MFNVQDFMSELATNRPIFHSEADFQHAFAWQLHKHYEDANIRLEYPIEGMRLDILVTTTKMKLAIELKYKTKTLVTDYNKERFQLKNHGAQDLGKYDFLKDVTRLERITKLNGSEGYAVLLTNDNLYWGIGGNETMARNFHLHDTRILNGKLNWYRVPSRGTTKNREETLAISGNYLCKWADYSSVSDKAFRYLALKI